MNLQRQSNSLCRSPIHLVEVNSLLKTAITAPSRDKATKARKFKQKLFGYTNVNPTKVQSAFKKAILALSAFLNNIYLRGKAFLML